MGKMIRIKPENTLYWQCKLFWKLAEYNRVNQAQRDHGMGFISLLGTGK